MKNILILEDDQSLSSALSEAFRRAGHNVETAAKPDEARPILSRGTIDILFVDCLLPQMAGVDFVREIRAKLGPDRLAVIFMSGIYTDKNFIKEAIEDHGAQHFLQKPFDLKEALELVGEDEEAMPELSPRQELYAILSKPDATERDKRKALERVEQIHGYDLPYIYSLLVDSRMTGHLNIVTDEGSVSGISFHDGSIVGVDVQDKETYVGKLLIDSGYITNEELQIALADKTQKKMGQRLIHENFISPHAFDEILGQQMNIRLARTIVPQSLKLNFVAADVENAIPRIEPDAFISFLHDWVTSKVSESWLENHYRSWGSYIVKPQSHFQVDNPIFYTPLLRKTPKLYSVVSSQKTLDELADASEIEKGLFYKALHLLFITGNLTFSEQVSEVNQQKRMKRLSSLLENISKKNYFEIYEVMGGQRKLVGDELEVVYQDFLRALGDEPSEIEDPDGHKVWSQVAEKAKQTYELLGDEGKRLSYQQSLEQSEMERKFTAQRKFDEGQAQLKTSQFQRALATFKEVYSLAPDREGLILYILWAKLGTFDSSTEPFELLKSVEGDMLKVPPEDKHVALYAFVMGLYHKCSGDQGAAKREFTKAASMDATLVQARRELNLLSIKTQQKPKDFLKRDLKDLVGALFKKKDSA